ncbi:MAG: N,N-dimethylformamidase beta subunit family domain-containing protein [Cyclobacteriaceae bacterium]
MKNKKGLSRRDAIKLGAGSSLALTLGTGTGFRPLASKKVNPIMLENEREGTTDWQLTRVRYDQDLYRSPFIEGFCSRQSVHSGEKLDIMVSTAPAKAFQIDIFRTGFYQGKGGRWLKRIGPLSGKSQPTPSPGEKNVHECEWEVSTSLVIPDDWLSGVYLGKLRTLPENENEPYWESYILFIVKDTREADLLFQCSDNTWQAYNRWPNNYSIYTHPKGVQGPWAKVSFDRPYGRQAQFTGIVNDPLSFGSGEFISFERPFSYFLEQHGYDVTYCSNSDMLTPDRGLKTKVFLSIGHDEYWDIRQFKSVAVLKEKGVNLMFFSGNSVCWVSPFTESKSGNPNGRIFRAGPYGANNDYALNREKSFGPFPERGPDEGLLMGVRNIQPINGGGDWIVKKPDHWMFEGTGMQLGDRIPGLIGWEFHGDAASIDGLEVVAEGTAWQGGVNPSKWQSVIYPGPNKNFIFNASTIFWAQGLSSPPGHTLPWSHFSRPHGPDQRVQKITHNLLQKAISST